jgi:hypothetical protein
MRQQLLDEFNDAYAGIGIPSSKPGLRNFFAIRSKRPVEDDRKEPPYFWDL